jgi:hypothetical protein
MFLRLWLLLEVHWVASMSGVVAISAGIIQHLRGAKFPPIAWIIVGTACLFVAAYQAWLDQRTSYLTERCKIEKFEKRSVAKNELASLRNQADQLIYGNLTKNSSAEEVSAWFSAVNSWTKSVSEWTKNNLGLAAVSKVIDVTNIQPFNWDRAISPVHNAET